MVAVTSNLSPLRSLVSNENEKIWPQVGEYGTDVVSMYPGKINETENTKSSNQYSFPFDTQYQRTGSAAVVILKRKKKDLT